MKVKTVESTNDAEKIMCSAARGDYMEDWNGSKSFAEIMEPVDCSDENIEKAKENNYYPEISDELEAKMVSFIEKQLSRGHFGPAEHIQISFTVKGISRVTMAQLTRHRFLTADVQSQRYANFEDAEIVVPASLLTAEERHNRYPHVFDEDGTHISREKGLVDIEEDVRAYYREEYELTTQHELDQYQSMVEAGIPKEDARFILPEGTPVNLTVSGNARTFLHLLDMRKKANSQWEIHELAAAMLDELFEWMPVTFEYYKEHGPNRLSP